MSLATKLQKVLETKKAIKQALINKNIPVADTDPFSTYPTKINSIDGDGVAKIFELIDGIVTELTADDLIGVTGIRGYAFAYTALKSVVIPSNVTIIGIYAFYHCSSLETITLSEGIKNINQCAFSNCSKLKSIIIPEGISIIDRNSFEYCKALTDVTLPESLTKIENYAFSPCESLNNIVIPANVTSIGANAFAHCSSLESIVIPSGTTYIFARTFDLCTALKSVTFEARHIHSIGNYAFYYCSSLETIDLSKETGPIPELTSISAFQGTPDTLKILVPTALYDDWIAAKNWSNSEVVSKIYGVDADGNIVNSPS